MAADTNGFKASKELQVKILNQIPAPVMAVDKDMKIIYLNDRAVEMTGESAEKVIGQPCNRYFNTNDCNSEDCCMRKSLKTGEAYSRRTEALINGEELSIEYYTVPLKNDADETIGGLEFVVDITKQVQYENSLLEQSNTINKLSTPTIKLWNGILMLPIIGVIDSIRAQNMMETMLDKIAETYSRVIILDIFGVAAVDTAVAQHLIKIAKATKLMGCDCILSGISPPVAQTIVQLGIDMENIHTKATLADAFAEALEIMNMRVTNQ